MAVCSKCGIRGKMLKVKSIQCDLNGGRPYFGASKLKSPISTCAYGGTFCPKCYKEITFAKGKSIVIKLFDEKIFKDIQEKEYVIQSAYRKQKSAYDMWIQKPNEAKKHCYRLYFCSPSCLNKYFKMVKAIKKPTERIKPTISENHYTSPCGEIFFYVAFSVKIFNLVGDTFKFQTKNEPAILMREALKTKSAVKVFDENFKHPKTMKKLHKKRTLEEEKEIKGAIRRAKELELKKDYATALDLYVKLEMTEEISRLSHIIDHISRQELIAQANNYSLAGKFEEAANLYDELELWEEAGEVRKMAKEPTAIQHQYIVDHIDMSTKAEIKDSIIHKSPIGGGGSQRPFSICPYCSEELNLPKTPQFCPYCREQLQE